MGVTDLKCSLHCNGTLLTSNMEWIEYGVGSGVLWCIHTWCYVRVKWKSRWHPRWHPTLNER